MDLSQNSSNCQWPDLASSYDMALQSAVAYILERFPVLGIIASGSIIRGNPGPTYYQTSNVQTQAQLADTLARRILGVIEFFEWESKLQIV